MNSQLAEQPPYSPEANLTASLATDRAPLTRAQKRAMLAAALGTVVEYTDWVIYAMFAPLFSPHFFPSGDATASLLSSLAVFAVGFVMRPVGGAVLGSYSDRFGRKKGMTLSISLMACASLVIAVCPGYDAIGIWASLILVAARMVQGFSAGGEFGSASAFLVEMGPAERRGFAGSLQHLAGNAGGLVATLIGFLLTSLFSQQEMAAWGWRIGFAIAGLLGGIVLWLRLAVGETAAFRRSVQGHEKRQPLRAVLRDHPKAALLVIGITMAGTLVNYLWLVHFPTYLHMKTGVSLREAFGAGLIALIVSLIAIPCAGALSDRIGRRPILLAFAAGSMLFAGPSLALLSGNFWADTAILVIGVVLSCGYSGTCVAVMAELFPATVRATGISLPYSISVTIFGGSLPYIMTALERAGLSQVVWAYIALICFGSFVVFACMRETRGKPLD